MRWIIQEPKVKPDKRPKDFEQRIIKKFLLLPHLINKEVRWLEYVCISQIYRRSYFSYTNDETIHLNSWIDIDWTECDK